MRVLGVDPGSEHVGLAVRVNDEVVYLGAVRMLPELHRSWARIDDVLTRYQGFDAVLIERPPPTVRADVEHGPQAVIGYAIGRVTGAVESWCWSRGIVPQLVDVSTWRDAMLVDANRRGLRLVKPSRHAVPDRGNAPARFDAFTVKQTPGTGGATGRPPSFDLEYTACGHRHVAGSFDQLAAARRAHPTCAICSPAAKPAGPADVRERWKEAACAYANLVAPSAYRALVEHTRSRAKTIRHDWQLAGVADACEALGLTATAWR